MWFFYRFQFIFPQKLPIGRFPSISQWTISHVCKVNRLKFFKIFPLHSYSDRQKLAKVRFVLAFLFSLESKSFSLEVLPEFPLARCHSFKFLEGDSEKHFGLRTLLRTPEKLVVELIFAGNVWKIDWKHYSRFINYFQKLIKIFVIGRNQGHASQPSGCIFHQERGCSSEDDTHCILVKSCAAIGKNQAVEFAGVSGPFCIYTQREFLFVGMNCVPESKKLPDLKSCIETSKSMLQRVSASNWFNMVGL